MQKYLAIYEIDSPDIVESKAWEEASAWGDWATKIRPHTTSRHHSYFREILRAGKGRDASSPYIYVVQMDIPAAHEAEFNRVYDSEHAPMLAECVDGANPLPARKVERQPDAEIHGDLRDRLAIGHREQGMAGGRRPGRLGDQNPPAHHQPAPHNFQEDLRSQAHRDNPLSASPCIHGGERGDNGSADAEHSASRFFYATMPPHNRDESVPMTTLLYTHPACLEHDPGSYHPESPARLRAVLEALDGPDFARLDRREAPEAALDDIARVHPRRFVERAAGRGAAHPAMSGSTPTRSCRRLRARPRCAPPGRSSPRSMRSSRARPTTPSARCARPAIMPSPAGRWGSACSTTPRSARCGRARRTASPVSRSIDFDVHHGNGTQACFCDDAEPVLCLDPPVRRSIPAPARRGETGVGNIVNVPLRPMAGSREFRSGVSRDILPALDAFRPGPAADLGRVRRPQERPARATCCSTKPITPGSPSSCSRSPARHAGGRVVSTLEGGYDLAALGASAAAHVRVLMAA